LAQRETLGAIGAQPEVFNFFMFCFLLVCVEAKKPASVEAHEGFGALRIGTLRDHESVALPITLDDRSQGGVARKSQAPEFQFGLCTAHFLSAIQVTHRQLLRLMSKAHIYWEKITSLCRPERNYLFAFSLFCGNPVALFHIDNERYS